MKRSTEEARDPVTLYSELVLADEITAGRLVQAACQRHIDDLTKGPKRGLLWCPDLAVKHIDFAGFTKHSKGEFAGQRLELALWQKFRVGSVFGWLRADSRARRFRTAYNEVARKNGKALALDTQIAMPTGWKPIGELMAGDQVFDETGAVCRVTKAFETLYGRECFEIIFSDGERIVADADHLWRVKSRRPAAERVLTTREIASTIQAGNGSRVEWNHSIATSGALTLPDVDLPIPPYTLGAWLGDGTSETANLTCADGEILERIKAEGVTAVHRGKLRYRLGGGDRTATAKAASLERKLRVAGLLNNKHIPAIYQRASAIQRLELLRGIMDTDGYASAAGQCELVTVCANLHLDYVDLIRGLGFKPTVKIDRAKIDGRDCGPRFRIQFWAFSDRPVFHLSRKASRLKPPPLNRTRSATRQIIGARLVPSVPVRCITVDSPSHLFLAGRGLVPTHNSTEAAYVGIDALLFDGEQGAEVYSAATKKDQARLVFDEARRMVRSSPVLKEKLRIFKNAIAMDSTSSAFQPLSSDANTLDGLNPSGIIIDELHKHRDRDLLDVLDTATGARRQPLIWIITTAGDDRPDTVYAAERDYAEKVVTRVLEDDSYFAYIATLDEGDRWDDPKVWVKANPNLGISAKLEDIERQCTKAKGSPAAQVAFKRLRCNLRVSNTVRAINLDTWRENVARPEPVPSDPPPELDGRDAFAAFDISSKIDLTAAAIIFPPIAEETRWRLFVKFWCPGENVADREDRDKIHYQRWIDEHWITPTIGNVVDQDEVKAQLLEWRERFNIKACPYDTWDATKLALELADKGMPVQEFIQGLRSYSHPCKEFLALIESRKLDHGNNPVMTWMASNVAFDADKNLNLMPTKKKSSGRIDGMTATIMAYGAAVKPDENGPYNERGLIILGA